MDGPRYTSQIDAPVEFPPRRVVSLVPSLTESLFDLGLGERLVAVTDHCIYPEGEIAQLPKVGSSEKPDMARIASLTPDLVLASDDCVADVIDALRHAGLTVWVTAPRTVREVFNLLWNIMHLFDAPEMVERIRSVEWVADWLERMSAQREAPCRVFAAAALEPLTTANAHTYTHDLIRVCGGRNVFADSGERYPRVTLEEVAAARPDVVLLPSAPDAPSRAYADRLCLLDIPAARDGAIYRIDRTLLTWPGTRIARALDQLPGLICPQKDAHS